MAIKGKAMLGALIDPATTTCLFIDRSLGFHCSKDALRPLCWAPACPLSLSLSLSLCASLPCSLSFVTMGEIFNIASPVSSLVCRSTKASRLRRWRLALFSSNNWNYTFIKFYLASGGMDVFTVSWCSFSVMSVYDVLHKYYKQSESPTQTQIQWTKNPQLYFYCDLCDTFIVLVHY